MGQETAAMNANAPKDGLDIVSLPRSLGDQLATESVVAGDHVRYLELAVVPQRMQPQMRCQQTFARSGGCSY
jgi:hypothetical protein